MPRTKIDRRIVKTKRAINLALLQLLAEKSVDDITITELTAKADINRKTFYLHYTCVKDVADELTEKLFALFETALGEALGEDQVFIPAKFFEFVRDKINEQPELFRAFCLENTCLYFTNVLGGRIMDTLMNVYRKYSAMNEAALRLVLTFMVHGALNIYLDWVRTPSALTLDEVTALVLRLVEQGTALAAE